MPLKLYDLAGHEDTRRFSPNCWRIRLALAHKGLTPETVPWRFTEKSAIAFSGQERVPVLVDGERVLSDSWDIACYLEETYPEPPLFGGPQARAEALFIKHWIEATIHPLVLRIIVMDLYRHLHPKDRAYFRHSREARFGTSLEIHASQKAYAVAALRQDLDPVRRTLRGQDWMCGESPGFADYMLFGAFQWARCVSPERLLKPEDAVYAWRQRMLSLFDGLAAACPGYPV